MRWLNNLQQRLTHSSNRKITTKPSSPISPCVITTIPMEILFCILDHVPHTNLLILSHTCKALYNGTQYYVEKTAKQSISFDDHRLYLWLFCKSKFDRFVCLDCNSTHSLDVMNLPYNRHEICARSKGLYGSSLQGPFQLDHSHVQLACKLNQATYNELPRLYRTFLDTVLAQCHIQPRHLENARGAPDSVYKAQAAIIRGKFILYRAWGRYYNIKSHRTTNMEDIFGYIQICPHLRTSMQQQNSTQPLNQYQQPTLCSIVERVLQDIGSVKQEICRICATDFAVCITASGHASLYVFQTLGGIDYESYQHWEGHLWKDNTPIQNDPWIPVRRAESLRLFLDWRQQNPNVNTNI